MLKISNNYKTALVKKAVFFGIAFIIVINTILPNVNSNSEVQINKDALSTILNNHINKQEQNLNPSPLNIIDPWWNPSWQYRKEITINHSKIDVNLTNFPVLINISSDGDLSNSSKCQIDGDDIIFVEKNGDKIFHEIEYFNATKGKLIVWVKIPSLLSTMDKSFYMYYGNSTIGNQQNRSNVWDNNYTLVQHLNETSGLHYDSTIYANDGTAYNDLNQSGYGIIDGADTFDANDDYIDCSNDSSLEPGIGDFTFEAWIKRQSIGSNHCIVSKRASASVGYIWWVQHNNVLRFIAKPGEDTINIAAGSISDLYWHHVAITLDRDDIASVFVDGELITTRVISTAPDSISTTKFLSIGREMRDDVSDLTFDGTIDEVRISNSARNSSWIKTEYNNQIDPSAFHLIGVEEKQPKTPIVYSPYPPDKSLDVDITVSKLSFNLSHWSGSTMNYWIETSPNIGSDNAIGVGNGTYNISISGLTHDTTYKWYVNVTDGYNTSNISYDFKTRSRYIPGIPSDFTASVISSNQIDLGWSLGVNSDRTYVEWNSSAVWILGDGTLLYNDSGSGVSHSGLDAHTTYYYQAWGWNETDKVFSSVFASDDDTTWNTVPVLSDENPSNNSIDVEKNLEFVSVSIFDSDGDLFDWSIEISNGDNDSASDDNNGVKSCNLTIPLNYNTTYTWWVNVTDGIDNINLTFTFTTKDQQFWDITLDLIETSGLKDNVVFGEASNASDGQDNFDVPKPSAPPSPFIYAWFDAGLSEPYNVLWKDYRKYPDIFKVWNLSVLWDSSSNDSTNVTINWNSSNLSYSEYNSIFLKDISADILIDMHANSNYTFNILSLVIYEFQIICSNAPFQYDYSISLESEWNMVSLPVNQSFNKDNITVNYLGVNYSWNEAVSNSIILDFVYSWNPTNKIFEVTDVIDPGKGYWLYTYYECDLWISSMTNTNDLITDLFIEWNLIGLPHDTQVAKDNITVYYNGTEFSWQEAVNNNIILNYIYYWNATDKIYEITDILQPGKGYWIYAYYDCTLKK
jgi:hypothetical protein